MNKDTKSYSSLVIGNKEYFVSDYVRIIDKLMSPLMFVLGGFNTDSIQETHMRHCADIDPEFINDTLGVNIAGDSASWVKGSRGGLAHMPILGGRKTYVVLENKNNLGPRFVGWKVENDGLCQIHKLPIQSDLIRVLKGPIGKTTTYFGFDKDGKQVPIDLVDQGILGDRKYKNIRLF